MKHSSCLAKLILLLMSMSSCKYHTVPDGIEIQIVKDAAAVANCRLLGEVRVDGPDFRQVYKEAQFQVWQLKGDTLRVKREHKMLIGKLNEYTLEAEALACLMQVVPEFQEPGAL